MTEEESQPTGSFPALSSLGLSREQLGALTRQGSLSADTLASQKRYYKLRFTFQGKRQVRYLGANLAFVEQVRRELTSLQESLKVHRRLRRLAHRARSCLRETKACLEPVLAETGHYYHGREIRKRRQTNRPNINRCHSSHEYYLRKKIMDDRHKPQEDALSRRPQNSPAASSSPLDRHRERLQELFTSALDLKDPRQIAARCGMAQLFSVSSEVANQV